ncbi:hypothetical protein [Haloplanus pelagicus]|jgi:hypothetical protein|uniref:hypothetical protein n=1 Tax=Haloplanus pelagicus TaxID=2949995 RepID=UPI002040C5FA|nr:hypothetical protein [Haloplanus sp. HW8-1]
MNRSLSTLLAALVALSLVGAPVTMADWGEQATVSAEPVEPNRIDDETPVLQYRSLSPSARTAVRRAIEDPDGTHVIYGQEDFPEDFAYSDYSEPGYGLYAVAYEGQHYRLYTYAAGGFPFVYWLYELPFVVYGLVLGLLAFRVARGERSPRTATLAALPGVAVHLLGPEFDFPLLAPMAVVALGALSAAIAVVLLVRDPDLDLGDVRRG